MHPPADHHVAVLAFDGVIPFDLTLACETFRRAEPLPGQRRYEVRVCAPTRQVRTDLYDMQVRETLAWAAQADTVIVPGQADVAQAPDAAVLDCLRTAHATGARVASLCTGAFILAATGLLDGLRVTTHWRAAAALAQRFPALTVDANVLYVDHEDILTSAGASAGLDLCLHMVRRDHGNAVAADAARCAVMPLGRDGGQAQFIVHEPPSSHTNLSALLQWMEQRLDQPLTLADMAGQAAMSIRTLNRRFLEQLDTTPRQWLLRTRVRRSQTLLETTALPIEQVAQACGFGSATSLREHFSRIVGVSPTSYRKSFGGARLPASAPRHSLGQIVTVSPAA